MFFCDYLLFFSFFCFCDILSCLKHLLWKVSTCQASPGQSEMTSLSSTDGWISLCKILWTLNLTIYQGKDYCAYLDSSFKPDDVTQCRLFSVSNVEQMWIDERSIVDFSTKWLSPNTLQYFCNRPINTWLGENNHRFVQLNVLTYHLRVDIFIVKHI